MRYNLSIIITLFFFVLSIVGILIFPKIFDPTPPLNDYYIEIEAPHAPNDAYIRDLHYNFDFVNKEAEIKFRVHGFKDTIIIRYSDQIKIINHTLIDDSLSTDDYILKGDGVDYDNETYAYSDRGSIDFYDFNEKFKESTLGIILVFHGSLYPKGSFELRCDDINDATSFYNREDPAGFAKERISFDLGDKYKCEPQCVVPAFLWKPEGLVHLVIPTKKGERIKVAETAGISVSSISLILNTYNKDDLFLKDVSVSFSIAVLAGSLMSLASILSVQKKKKYTGNKSKKTYHTINCLIGKRISSKNLVKLDESKIIAEGYKPCNKCIK